MSARKKRNTDPTQGLSGRRRRGGSKPPFSEEKKNQAIELVRAGMARVEVARKIGCTTESLRQWCKRAEAMGTLSPPVTGEQKEPATGEDSGSVEELGEEGAALGPRDPGFGLGEHEVEAILDLKRRHPAMGPAQIRAQLKRRKGWRVSSRAIARVLRSNGYELEHRGSRPKGQEKPQSFEAPYRNALWQADFAELRIGPERRSLLLIEDDFSRFCVAYELLEHPTSEAVVEVLREAIRFHGKPEAFYTDRGGSFLAWRETSSLGQFLEAELIDHHVSRPYRPQGRGKIESLVRAVVRELWEVEHFSSVDEAEAALSRFFRHYNHERAHMGIDGLVPADRFFGRWPEVKAAVEAKSRRRQDAPALLDDLRILEEGPVDGRVELLRLLAVGGEIELRFLGHRVRLGRIEG
jgi:transposase InsO family protein/transposase-like protein